MSPGRDLLALKAAWRGLVRLCGGIDATAACCRVGRSLISEYGAGQSGRMPPVDVVCDVEEIAGEPLMTSALARAQGFRLVPVEVRGAGEIGAALARIGRDCGAIFASAAHVLSGGAIADEERVEMLRDLDDLARAANEALALLQSDGGRTWLARR